MSTSANRQVDTADERRRAASAVAVGAVAVIAVLAIGQAVSAATAFLAATAIVAFAVFYVITAGAPPGDPTVGETNERGPEPKTTPRDHPAEVLEVLPEPVLVVGADDRLEAANAAARAAFALTRSGAPLSTVLRAPEVLEAVEEARRSGAPQSVAYRTMAPRERHMRAFVAALSGGPDSRGAVIAVHDETAMKLSERMRADFLADASHELRTPLASMALCVDTLRGHARDDPEARERFFAIMTQQGNHMRRLIDDLLSLSRIELDEHVPPRGHADLAAVAADVVDALAPLAHERDVTIELVREDARAPVLGERDQLVQVVQNLIDNAVKYSRVGGRVIVSIGCGASAADAPHDARPLAADSGRLSIVAPTDGEGASYAWLRVRDFGPGIESRHLPRLSERFFRVEEAEIKTGTGLGLAIVKHIMSRHRGGFAVESAPGEGSIFSIYAPHTPEAARAKLRSVNVTAAA